MALPAEPISSSQSRNSVGPMMLCPFCAEEIRDEAIFCRHCRHDLTIPKPLMEQAKALQQRIGELEAELAALRAAAARQAVDRSPPELTGEAHGFRTREICPDLYARDRADCLGALPDALPARFPASSSSSSASASRCRSATTCGAVCGGGRDRPVLLPWWRCSPLSAPRSWCGWWTVWRSSSERGQWRLTIELAIGLALGTVTGNLFASVLKRHRRQVGNIEAGCEC